RKHRLLCLRQRPRSRRRRLRALPRRRARRRKARQARRARPRARRRAVLIQPRAARRNPRPRLKSRPRARPPPRAPANRPARRQRSRPRKRPSRKLLPRPKAKEQTQFVFANSRSARALLLFCFQNGRRDFFSKLSRRKNRSYLELTDSPPRPRSLRYRQQDTSFPKARSLLKGASLRL